MKTFGGASAVAVVVALMVSLWTVEAQSVMLEIDAEKAGCPPPVFEWRDGKCTMVNEKIRDAVTMALNRRKFVNPTEECPYCARGVLDGFPDWDDCKKFNYCVDGQVISLKCGLVGGNYFNPVNKACELFPSKNNICLNRNVNLNPIPISG